MKVKVIDISKDEITPEKLEDMLTKSLVSINAKTIHHTIVLESYGYIIVIYD